MRNKFYTITNFGIKFQTNKLMEKFSNFMINILNKRILYEFILRKTTM